MGLDNLRKIHSCLTPNIYRRDKIRNPALPGPANGRASGSANGRTDTRSHYKHCNSCDGYCRQSASNIGLFVLVNVFLHTHCVS